MFNIIKNDHILCDQLFRRTPVSLYFFKTLIYLYYLFLAALGLRCCTRAFSSCGKQGLLFVAVCGLLIVAEHGL